MRRGRAILLCLGLLAGSASAAAGEIAAIAYHDIVPRPNGDPYAVTLREFERQMEYLKRTGYQPISLRALDDARQGRRALPDKPVLLTFDDGLKSYYLHALPVLRRYDYPSVVSIVTSWTDGRTRPDDYRGGFMTWDELRELARAPQVEIASHTDDLHRGVPANPWGSLLPAGVTRAYDRGYETEAVHAGRVADDLARSVERLRTELGRAPIAVTWPYGEYDATLVEAAANLGMTYHLALGVAPTRLEELPRINRTTLKHYRNLADFADALSHKTYRRQQLRFVEIDLEIFTGKDRAGQELLLSRLLARLEILRVNGVLIKPFSADGRAFFHNAVIAVEADLLSRVTQQLIRRTSVAHIYLRVPVLGAPAYRAVYTDLARLNWFNGVVLEGEPDPKQVDAARALFARYRPMLRVGADAGTTIDRVDFQLLELGADAAPQTLTRQAAALLRNAPNALFLLRRTGATTERTLRAAMQALRVGGAAHYGYGPDDVLNDAPTALGVIGALHEHTVTGVSR